MQYGAEEFAVEGGGPVDGRYTSPKAAGIYADSYYDQASGSWYSTTSAGPYGGPSSNYHNVAHASHLGPQPHDHYAMSPGVPQHLDPQHMNSPQPLPPMSSFRGSSNSNGASVPPESNPAHYNSQHSLQNNTLVGKALQTVRNVYLFQI